MAISKRIDGPVSGKAIKERFAQLAKAGMPFNPAGRMDIFGGNLERLQKGMEMFSWEDPRFMTEIEAEENGWSIDANATAVKIPLRDRQNGSVLEVDLYNAENIRGIPTLSAMLAMSDAEILKLQGREVAEPEQSTEDELQMLPALKLENEGPKTQLAHGQNIVSAQVNQDVIDQSTEKGRLAVMAPYWLNGLHNYQGIMLANEINESIKDNGLAENKEGIKQLLKIFSDARRFGLEIVDEKNYLENPHFKANQAEPEKLLDGLYVRDKKGAYRPAVGGRAVLEDKGDSLVLKNKDKSGYAAAMELAQAKGWTAIELTGKPAMLADAWLEAKLIGLDVVNYSPSKEDEKKFAERLAQQQSAERSPAPSRTMEQEPEKVEVRPYIDPNGQEKTAYIVHSFALEKENPLEEEFTNPIDAAKRFAEIPGSALPTVMRITTRAGEVVQESIVAGTDLDDGTGEHVKSSAEFADRAFDEAFAAVVQEQKALSKKTEVSTGMHSGTILAIEDGIVTQKVGRGPQDLVRHALSNLSRKPVIGEIESISYDKSGRGVLKEKGLARESAGHELTR